MTNIQKLIQINLEIEGLLRILAARESDEAKEMLYTRIGEFVTLVDAPESSVEIPDADTADDACPKNEVSEQPVDTMPLECEDTASLGGTDMPMHEVPEEYGTLEEATETTHNFSPEQVPVAEETVTEFQPEEKPHEEEPSFTRPNELRLDEAISRREAKDLRKAFTLNDKFRFRRELFCNNDPLFITTLDDISAMSSADEATSYLTDKFGWDLENEDVKDFVTIINNHFA